MGGQEYCIVAGRGGVLDVLRHSTLFVQFCQPPALSARTLFARSSAASVAHTQTAQAPITHCRRIPQSSDVYPQTSTFSKRPFPDFDSQGLQTPPFPAAQHDWPVPKPPVCVVAHSQLYRRYGGIINMWASALKEVRGGGF